MRRRWGGFAGGLVSLLALVLVVPAPAMARHWVVSPTPTPPPDEDRNLFATAGSGLGDVWAVGRRIPNLSTDGSVWEPLILHRASGRWSEVDGAPSHHDLSELNGVAVASRDDAWAVGIDFATRTSAMLEHWDGTRWTRYPTPGLRQQLNGIARIPGTDRFVLVGGFNGGPQIAAILKRGVWRFATLPTPPDQEIEVTSVAAVADRDYWAFGSDSDLEVDTSPGHAFAAHWDGRRWTRVRLPRFGAPNSPAILDATAVPGTDEVWAVGLVYLNRGTRLLELHYDGHQWSQLPTDSAEYGFLSGVTARGRYDVWATGQIFTGTDTFHTLVMHYDRTGWHTVSSPSPGQTNALYDVTSAGGMLWAVGATYADFRSPGTTLVERRR